jgi:hypothetical protein
MNADETKPNESATKDPASGSLDRVIKWLLGRDERHREIATSILRQLGRRVVEFLALELTKPGRRVTHLIRLSDMIESIGKPLDLVSFRRIGTLCKHRNVRVRIRAGEVLRNLYPEDTGRNDTRVIIGSRYIAQSLTDDDL